MAANPAQIHGELCDIPVCGDGSTSNVPSSGGITRMDLVLDRNVRMARFQGIGGSGEVSGRSDGKVDRRSKLRTAKQAVRLAGKGYNAVDKAFSVLDAPLIVCCVAFGVIYVLSRFG